MRYGLNQYGQIQRLNIKSTPILKQAVRVNSQKKDAGHESPVWNGWSHPTHEMMEVPRNVKVPPIWTSHGNSKTCENMPSAKSTNKMGQLTSRTWDMDGQIPHSSITGTITTISIEIMVIKGDEICSRGRVGI
jgi:hypothetical protein